MYPNLQTLMLTENYGVTYFSQYTYIITNHFFLAIIIILIAIKLIGDPVELIGKCIL